MAVPIANVISFAAVAFLDWPIHREVARLRLTVGEGSEADASCVLGHATKLETRGQWERAIALCELVADRMQGQPISEYARKLVEGVREKQAMAG